MLSPNLKRIRQLRAKDGTDKGLTAAEAKELDRLRFERNAELLEMVVRPTCCEAARDYPTITFEVPDREGRRATAGHWHAHVSKSLTTHKDSAWWEKMPAPKFCPFCGTQLAKMVLKKPQPKTVSVVTDGGYYCNNCRERLSSCLCDPPSFAFEPRKAPTP